MKDGHHAAAYHEQKIFIVEQVLRAEHAEVVLDLGCNTGSLSVVAARLGARVVAVDSDATSVGLLFSRAETEKLNILPLVIDLLDPTPARGWRNREYESFLSRAEGAFDTVLALSFVHHLLVTGGVPLHEILTLLAQLTTDKVIVEFIPRSDPMFVSLLRGREALYADYTRDQFVMLCEKQFTIVRVDVFPHSEREVFTLRKKH